MSALGGKSKRALDKTERLRRQLYREYLSPAYGLSPYNAALKAGYPEHRAQMMSALDIKCRNGKLDLNRVVSNIYEQEGYTVRRALRRMIAKAGLAWDGEGAATKIISAQVVVKSDDPTVKTMTAGGRTNDFVEVPDEYLQYQYISKLNDIAGLTRPDGSEGAGAMPYSIEISIVGKGAIGADTGNTTGNTTGDAHASTPLEIKI